MKTLNKKVRPAASAAESAHDRKAKSKFTVAESTSLGSSIF
ncbi:MAG: hypothetical protein ABFD54_18180 [Armatimonadota bacterium]